MCIRDREQSIGIHYNVGKSVLDYVNNREDFEFTDGFVKLPRKPGLGVEVNKELVEEENLSLIHIFPVYLYGAYLLGVKPEKPGRWRQEKRVDCGVRRVSGILKSPQGYMEFGTKRK